jgi:hypothetical protein
MPNSNVDSPGIPCDVRLRFTSNIGVAQFNRRFYLPAIPRPGESCVPVDDLQPMVIESISHRFEGPHVEINFLSTECPADHTWQSLYAYLTEAGWDLDDATGSIIRSLNL